MKVTCKNIECKHFYKLKKGEHCPAEDECAGYTSNRKKAYAKILKCKNCEYCKRIYTKGCKEYHYECVYDGRNKTILFVNERRCDCRI